MLIVLYALHFVDGCCFICLPLLIWHTVLVGVLDNHVSVESIFNTSMCFEVHTVYQGMFSW